MRDTTSTFLAISTVAAGASLAACATLGVGVGGRVSALARIDTGEPVILASPELAAGRTWSYDGGAFVTLMAGWQFDVGYEGGVGFTGGSSAFADLVVGADGWGFHLRAGGGAGFDENAEVRGLFALSAGLMWAPVPSAAPRSVLTLDFMARRPTRGPCTTTDRGLECPPDQAWQLGVSLGYSAGFEWSD